MKTSRLKSIVIVILALLNAFLLVLLVSRRTQEHSAQERRVQQLIQLYASNGVSLPAALIPDNTRLAPVDPARDLDAEASFAEELLGPCTPMDVGGGIYRYVNETGQCLLRSSGSAEVALDRGVDDPLLFCNEIGRQFGYELLSSELEGGSGSVRIIRRLSEGIVFNALLEFSFSERRLLSVTGSFLPAVDPAVGDGDIDAVSALVRFLDYSSASGEVCTEITGVSSGYLLQSTASAAMRLIPAWCINTDANQYYVNMMSGEVSRDA